MAFVPHTTPARVNPTWVSPAYPYQPLARFFDGRGAAPIINRPAPVRPAPAEALA